ncbi:MAG: hypothetical protein ABI340_10435 [Nitrososphaera sp.]|jgi:hypothetical protein
MFPRTQKRKAISTVLTTLIILVASVVLGTGVVLYGTSLFQTGAQSQGISTTGTSVWVDSSSGSGWAWGAADVRNSGDKLLSVDSIQIRGQQVPFTNWYANSSSTAITSTIFQQALNFTKVINPNTGTFANGTAAQVDNAWLLAQCPHTTSGSPQQIAVVLGTSKYVCMSQQSGPVSLTPGQKAIIYFKVPQNLLTSVDAGATASVALYAGTVGSPVTVTIASK